MKNGPVIGKRGHESGAVYNIFCNLPDAGSLGKIFYFVNKVY